MKHLIRKLLREGLEEARSIEGDISKEENLGELLTHIFNKYGFDNTYVSFRDSQNVGKINPNNKYNTPTGLYTYNLSNFLDKPIYNLDEFRSKFPFAADRKYIQFLITKDGLNLINSNYSKVKLDGYVNQIQSKFGNIGPVNGLCERWLKGEYESYYGKANHPPHKFWLFIFDAVPYIYPNGEKNNSFAILCRSLGINGFDDDKCEGWIHPSEECQTVFFRSNLFKDEFILKPNMSYLPDLFKGKSWDNVRKRTDNEIIKGISQHKINPIENFDDLIPYLNNPKIKNYMSNFIYNLSVDSIIELLNNTANPELAFNLLPNNGENFLDILIKDDFILLLGKSLWPKDVMKVLGSKGDEFISNLDIFDMSFIFHENTPAPTTIIDILLANEVFVSRVDSDMLYELLNHVIKKAKNHEKVKNKYIDRIINLINFMSNDNKAELMFELGSGDGLSTLLSISPNPDELINKLLNEEDFMRNLKYDSSNGKHNSSLFAVSAISSLLTYSSEPEMIMNKVGEKSETEFLLPLNNLDSVDKKNNIKSFLQTTNEPHKLLKSLGEAGEEFIVNLNFDDVRELFSKRYDKEFDYYEKIFELLMSNGKFVSNLPSWAIPEMLTFGRKAYTDIRGTDRYNDIFNWVKQQFIKYGHGKSVINM